MTPPRAATGSAISGCTARATAPETGGWQPLVRDLAHRTRRDALAVLDGLDPALLDVAVAPGANPIGWLLWHLTRGYDRNVSELRCRTQLWISHGWHARFGRPADPADTGYRHSRADVAAFRSPAPEVIVGYHRAVVEMLDDYLRRAPAADPDRVVRSPTLADSATVHLRLVGVVTDGLQHVGQAALLRGLLDRRRHGG